MSAATTNNSLLEKDDQRMAPQYAPPAPRKFANPAPLGLSAFALTTFVLGCINMGTRNITEASIVIGPAFGYGGLVQLLAGMWYVDLAHIGRIDNETLPTNGMHVGKWRSGIPSAPQLCHHTVDSGSRSASSLLRVGSGW